MSILEPCGGRGLNSKLKLTKLFPVLLDLHTDSDSTATEIVGLHSGNLGDIIYSLPTAFALGVNHYIINICQDPNFAARVLTVESALALAPLLLGQGTINRVTVINSQVPWEYADPQQIAVNYVLDSFRRLPNADSIHLLYRHALVYKAEVTGNLPWIQLKQPAPKLPFDSNEPYIVVGLTGRYRRHGDDYYEQLLQDVPPENLIFIGTESELYRKRVVPGQYIKARDHIELAWIIRQSALFIGNPSFPYALAEAMKVPRFVELPEGSNVAPLDPSGIPLDAYSLMELRNRIFKLIHKTPPEFTKMRHSLTQYEEWKDGLTKLLHSFFAEQGADQLDLPSSYRDLLALLMQIHTQKNNKQSSCNKQSVDRENSQVAIELAPTEFKKTQPEVEQTELYETDELRKKLLAKITTLLIDRFATEKQRDELVKINQELDSVAKENKDKLQNLLAEISNIFSIDTRPKAEPDSILKALKELKDKSDLFEQVTNSVSWRVTAPLRATKYKMRTWFKRQ